MTDPVQRYQAAVEALNRGDWPKAGALADALVAERPDHAGVHFVAGVAALQLGRMPHAMARLQAAIRISPQRPDYLAQFARGLATGRMFREATLAADRALAMGPQDPLTFDTLGVVYSQAGRHDRAVAVFRQAVAALPDNPAFRVNLASSLTFAGDMDDAEAEYEACLRLAPGHGRAHLALAQLRRQTPGRDHVERLRAALARAGAEPAATMYFDLALAKELEDLGDHPAAFAHLTAGKRAGAQGRGYTHERDRALFDAVVASFPEPVPHDGGFATDEPIFVIGMPRSGTTLVERILSSHPQVQSCGELQNFGVALKRASGSTTRPMLDADTIGRARGVDRSALGRAYLESTRPQTGQRPRFIDKFPHNFIYAGHIAAALPRAKIVCLRRHPLDTCLGNFRQLFALTSPFYDYSFDLLDTGRYYLQFDRLMAHWRRVLPGRILEFDYEALVAGQEAQSRRLLEFCGLPWDDAVLRFQDNAAPVATASAVQVREPLNAKSVGRWKRFETELAPLRALLRDGGLDV